MSIVVAVVGMPATSRKCESVAEARRIAVALARSHQRHWVHALREDGEVVHRIEPIRVTSSREPSAEQLALW